MATHNINRRRQVLTRKDLKLSKSVLRPSDRELQFHADLAQLKTQAHGLAKKNDALEKKLEIQGSITKNLKALQDQGVNIPLLFEDVIVNNNYGVLKGIFSEQGMGLDINKVYISDDENDVYPIEIAIDKAGPEMIRFMMQDLGVKVQESTSLFIFDSRCIRDANRFENIKTLINLLSPDELGDQVDYHRTHMQRGGMSRFESSFIQSLLESCANEGQTKLEKQAMVARNIELFELLQSKDVKLLPVDFDQGLDDPDDILKPLRDWFTDTTSQ